MELIDIYDRGGNKTGEIRERGLPLHEGEYILAVGMWVVDESGRIFITKRSPEKKFAPNKWENTGGHVQAGEDYVNAVLRELFEETGFKAEREDVTLLGTSRSGHYLGRDYGVRTAKISGSVKLQAGETCDAKWVDFDEFKRMAANGDFAPSVLEHMEDYKENFLKFIGQAADALPEKG